MILEVRIDTQDAYNKVAFEMIMFTIFISTLVVGNYQIITTLAGEENQKKIESYINIWNHIKIIWNQLNKLFSNIKNYFFPVKVDDEIKYIGNDPNLRKINIMEIMDELSNVNESETSI